MAKDVLGKDLCSDSSKTHLIRTCQVRTPNKATHRCKNPAQRVSGDAPSSFKVPKNALGFKSD